MPLQDAKLELEKEYIPRLCYNGIINLAVGNHCAAVSTKCTKWTGVIISVFKILWQTLYRKPRKRQRKLSYRGTFWKLEQ